MIQNRKDIEQYYATRRARLQQELAARISAFAELSPEYAQLRKQLLELRKQAAMAALLQNGAAEAQQALSAFQADFAQAQARLLQRYGYAADYLQLHYACPLCQDTGFVGEQKKTLCACFREKLPVSSLGGLDRTPTFDSFDESLFSNEKQLESARTLRGHLERYVQEFPHTAKNNLFLCGQTGLGKSFLLGCTASALTERGFSVKLVTAYHLMELFRAQHLGERDSMRTLTGVDFLVIDDLGTEPEYRNITVPYLYSLLNERSLKNRHTAVATNLAPPELRDRYGERISSRLLDRSCTYLFALSGEDLRLRK